MVTVSVTTGSGERGLMVWTPAPGMLKVMLSTPAVAFASRMAWRREPAPASFVFVTTKPAACTRLTSAKPHRSPASTSSTSSAEVKSDGRRRGGLGENIGRFLRKNSYGERLKEARETSGSGSYDASLRNGGRTCSGSYSRPELGRNQSQRNLTSARPFWQSERQ